MDLIVTNFRIFCVIIYCSVAIGRCLSVAPDLGKATEAVDKILTTIRRIPTIDASEHVGLKPISPLTGKIEIDGVKFSYPTRSTHMVLKDLSLTVHPGETVALVGSSGCGKSTLTQLVQRFYDISYGELLMDDHLSEDLSIPWLRRHIGVVSQEPVLFNRSVYENIAYGANHEQVTKEQVVEAAKQANIHSFVESLPMGYDTCVGPRGGQLSGGQKQRVAIARALIRRPTILILDEATSALDSESEAVVQDALDKARTGRTCLVIAHRLSTVRTADRIVVIENGRVVEQGTHEQLMASKGTYYEMNNA